jgi:predicted N-formylglutamate amidohydrolase
MASDGLLGQGDPDPVRSLNDGGASPFLLTADHAGNVIPRGLGSLGLSEGELSRHIAWDIGVAGMGALLSRELDAQMLSQRYSRLVIDCNRDPASVEAMPGVSDGTVIPGNARIGDAEIAARIAAVHRPYHDAIEAAIASRKARGQPTILIALHSFTPVLAGIARPWHIGIMHWKGRTDFARMLLADLRARSGVKVGDNLPYAMDATDYSMARHAFPTGLPYAQIEIRQDLVGFPAGQLHCARLLAASLLSALSGSE